MSKEASFLEKVVNTYEKVVHSKKTRIILAGTALTGVTGGTLGCMSNNTVEVVPTNTATPPAEIAPTQTAGVNEFAKFYTADTYGVGPLSIEFRTRESVCKAEFEKDGKLTDAIVVAGKVKGQKDGYAIWFCRVFKDASKKSYDAYLISKDPKSTNDKAVYEFNQIFRLDNKVTGESLYQTEHGIPVLSIGREDYQIYGKNQSIMATGKLDDSPGSLKALFSLMPVATPTPESTQTYTPEQMETAQHIVTATLNDSTVTVDAFNNRTRTVTATSTPTAMGTETATTTVVANSADIKTATANPKSSEQTLQDVNSLMEKYGIDPKEYVVDGNRAFDVKGTVVFENGVFDTNFALEHFKTSCHSTDWKANGGANFPAGTELQRAPFNKYIISILEKTFPLIGVTSDAAKSRYQNIQFLFKNDGNCWAIELYSKTKKTTYLTHLKEDGETIEVLPVNKRIDISKINKN